MDRKSKTVRLIVSKYRDLNGLKHLLQLSTNLKITKNQHQNVNVLLISSDIFLLSNRRSNKYIEIQHDKEAILLSNVMARSPAAGHVVSVYMDRSDQDQL